MRLEWLFLIWLQSDVDTCLISSCYLLDFGAIFKCSNARLSRGVFANNFLLSLAVSPSLIFVSNLLQFFFFLHHKRFKGLDTCQDYFLHEILTRSLSSFLPHSCKNCALRTLCPVSGLPEIMPFPYYLYRRLTSCRQSALSIIRVANPDVHIIAMVKGREPFFVKTVLNKKNPRSGCRQLMFCEVLCSWWVEFVWQSLSWSTRLLNQLTTKQHWLIHTTYKTTKTDTQDRETSNSLGNSSWYIEVHILISFSLLEHHSLWVHLN